MPWDKTVKTLLAAGILILFVGFIRPPSIHQGIPAEVLWAQKVLWQAEFDIVFAGDSRTYHGIAPSAMQEHLPGTRMANFGFSSCALAGEYLDAVEDLLDPASTNPIIVLGITPLSLTPHSSLVSEFLEYSGKSQLELLELKHVGPHLDFFEPIDFQHILNLFRDVHPGHHHYYYPSGWVAAERIPEEPEHGLRVYQDIVDKRGPDGIIAEPLVQALMDRIRQWTEQDITVYGFRPPATPKMEELEHTRMLFDEFEIVRRFKSAGGVWLVPDGDYLSDDGSHLHKDSAVDFSNDLARLIAEHQSE